VNAVAAFLRVLAVALLTAGSAAAQEPARITSIARGAEIAVQTVREGCTLDLSAQPAASPAAGAATQLRYRRQGGCRGLTWDRTALEVLQGVVGQIVP